MNSQRLKQIEEIYHAALEIPAAQRETFFKKFCGADAHLRREVESLLSFEKTWDNFLDVPPDVFAAEMFAGKDKPDNLLGAEIGHYKIVKLLGRGGMGAVYLAEDSKLDRKVALKILPPEFAENKERMSRFVREAKSASALNHPNILTIHEIGEIGETHFIATEFIDGKTLNEYAKTNPLDYKTALEIAIQITSALDEAHQAGIIHRDIKPDNVMIRANGLVKILDFGIAKLFQKQEEEKRRRGKDEKVRKGNDELTINLSPDLLFSSSPLLLTGAGVIIGTANYMSPEQAKGKGVDARTDIFSFGVLLYEMISGKQPFAGENAPEIIAAIIKDEPQPFDADVPSEIRNIIAKCLRKDLAKRYQKISEVGNDLKNVKQELELKNLMNRSTVPNREENQTQIQQAATADEIPHRITDQIVSSKPKSNYFAAVLLMLMLAVGGFFGYKYLTAHKQIESIAVMPFTIENGSSDTEYLSDGMTETLIGNLSQIPKTGTMKPSPILKKRSNSPNARRSFCEIWVTFSVWSEDAPKHWQSPKN